MNLFLCVIDDRRWQGLVEIEGETFKVNLFPGSAVKDWEAVLEVGGWVEISDDTKIPQAIIRALKSWSFARPTQPEPKPQEQVILEALKEHPELLDEILTVISMKEVSEDLVKGKEDTHDDLERV
jgi:hypothetical protein